MPEAGPLGQRILALANEILDPCSVAQAVAIGMVDMGMVLGVDVLAAADGSGRSDVRLRLRTTGPGCLYVVFFERELRARIEPLPEVASLAFAWDDAFDWTPDAMSEAARAELQQRRRLLLARLPGTGCE